MARATVLLAALLAACAAPAAPRGDARAAPPPAAPSASPSPRFSLGPGLVVWESNRSGAWRLWAARLDGSGAAQVSPDEPGRSHCCAHLAPDGTRLAWLSLDGGETRYDDQPLGVLHLTELATGADRVLAGRARGYGENRAAVWVDDRTLHYADAELGPARLDILSGERTRLVDGPVPPGTWLVDATSHWAVNGYPPTFAAYDAARRTLAPATPRGGCQPYFSHDGRFGFWTAGAGGPINRIELATGTVSNILKKNDARLPKGRGYLYFPMLSRSGAVFAWAASDGAHDHFRADYDLFAAAADPETLTISGPVVRLTEHPAVDRFPDVWTPPRPPGPPAAPRPAAPPAPVTAAGWPSDRGALAFLFEAGDRPNLVPDAEGGPARAWPLRREGPAWFGRRGALELRGGLFRADAELGARLAAAARHTNALAIEVTLEPERLEQSAPILALSDHPGARDFVLVQNAAALHLAMWFKPEATSPPLVLPADAARRPVHVALSYEPGRLLGWIDGELRLDTAALQGDFYHWRPRAFTVGGEPGNASRWRGRISGLAVFGRTLEPSEASENRRRRAPALGPPPAALEVEATVLACSTVPELGAISPYRDALATCAWRIETGSGPLAAGAAVRVAHWVWLDGEPTAAAARRPGDRALLRLEPWSEHGELEGHYLSDTLPPAPDPALWWDAGR